MTAYVLENNNQVLNGPRVWNYRSFESTLEEDLEILGKLIGIPAALSGLFVIVRFVKWVWFLDSE